MKRSEMCRELEAFLVECKQDKFSDSETAEAILNLLDEYHFLPPVVEIPAEESVGDEGWKPSSKKIRIWESENDQ